MTRLTEIGRPNFAGGTSSFLNEIIGILATLASRYYLAIIATGLAAALVGWGAGALLPKRYTSSVYLRLDESAARSADALMSATPTLDKVLIQVNIPGSTIEERRRRLDAQRSLAVAPNEIARTGGLFRMQVSDHDPARAHKIAIVFLDSWLEATKPVGDKKALLDQQIERVERELKWTLDSIEQVRKEPASGATTAILGTAVLGSPMTALIGKYEELGGALERLRQESRGVSRDVILSQPTLPEEPSSPRRTLIILSAVVVAELVLILWLFARERGLPQRWRS